MAGFEVLDELVCLGVTQTCVYRTVANLTIETTLILDPVFCCMFSDVPGGSVVKCGTHNLEAKRLSLSESTVFFFFFVGVSLVKTILNTCLLLVKQYT